MGKEKPPAFESLPETKYTAPITTCTYPKFHPTSTLFYKYTATPTKHHQHHHHNHPPPYSPILHQRFLLVDLKLLCIRAIRASTASVNNSQRIGISSS
mmetsp:Transcript_16298/g.19320  ORF Transcript_16298/g.19320 Transcript_16298/m.19320 type:complete len:98 (-) Transcript_16298:111-404(-)